MRLAKWCCSTRCVSMGTHAQSCSAAVVECDLARVPAACVLTRTTTPLPIVPAS